MGRIPGSGWDLNGSETAGLASGNRLGLDSGGGGAWVGVEREEKSSDLIWAVAFRMQGVPPRCAPWTARAFSADPLAPAEGTGGWRARVCPPRVTLFSAQPVPGATGVCACRAGECQRKRKKYPQTYIFFFKLSGSYLNQPVT